MTLIIKDAATHRLARKLAEATGETIGRAVTIAIRERLRKVQLRKTATRRLADRLDEIADHCAALPILRQRPIDEILGYADHGRPGSR